MPTRLVIHIVSEDGFSQVPLAHDGASAIYSVYNIYVGSDINAISWLHCMHACQYISFMCERIQSIG